MTITSHIHDLCGKYPYFYGQKIIHIQINEQKMDIYRWENNTLMSLGQYLISSAKAGTGNLEGSEKTPLGYHFIKECIGKKAPLGAIFKGRQQTGQIAFIEQQPYSTKKEYITSRILWLSGLEKGINCGKGIDSYQRYIYIHGTNEEGLIGHPVSKGCIRMKNQDIINIFKYNLLNSCVYIQQ